MRGVSASLALSLPRPAGLEGAAVAVVDVLRATTTIVHALAAGADCVRPCAEIDEALSLAASMPAGSFVLAAERGGEKVPGFALGNSPLEFTPEIVAGKTVVFTTSNGTRALHAAAGAGHVLAAAFVNLSACVEHLARLTCPVHVICAGEAGDVSWEDTLLAGALVGGLRQKGLVPADDGARLALAAWSAAGPALGEGTGGARLRLLGYSDDIAAAGKVDAFRLVPVVRRGPFRLARPEE